MGAADDSAPGRGAARGRSEQQGDPKSTTRWYDPLPRVLWDHAGAIGPSGCLVYAAIARHADLDLDGRRHPGWCWPSLATIADLTGLRDRRHVRRLVDRLEAAGLIRRQCRSGLPTRYHLVLGSCSDGCRTCSEADSTRGPQTPGLETPGVQTREPGGYRPRDPGATDPPKEMRPTKETTGAPKRAARPEIPAELVEAIPEMPELWVARMRAASRRPTPTAEAAQLRALAERLPRVGAEAIREHVEHVTAAGWQTIAADRLDRLAAELPAPPPPARRVSPERAREVLLAIERGEQAPPEAPEAPEAAA